jgi:hypothetical protein
LCFGFAAVLPLFLARMVTSAAAVVPVVEAMGEPKWTDFLATLDWLRANPFNCGTSTSIADMADYSQQEMIATVSYNFEQTDEFTREVKDLFDLGERGRIVRNDSG